MIERTGFEIDVSVSFRITGDELLKLQRLSQRHYDAVCRSAGQSGGFLFGFINQHQLSDAELHEPVEITATGHELGILAKIGEIEDYVPEPICGFAFIFQQMLKERQLHHRELMLAQHEMCGC